jgi:LacI family transcriptional regulator
MGSDTTLRDVAEKAGVSLGTASLALNNRPSVAPDTRARVVEAAVSLGYSIREPQKPVARIRTIGMLVKHDIGLKDLVNPFYSYVQLGVEAECRKRGLTLMYSTVDVDLHNRPIVSPKLIEHEQLHGLLLVGARLDAAIERAMRSRGAPLVLIDGDAADSAYDNVITDNYNGAFGAVTHLIDRGHRNIGVIGSAADSYSSIRERRRGYADALRSRGILTEHSEDSALNRAGSYAATQRLLQRSPEVTAVFACNDECALGVMDALHDMGLSIPHDICLVGFDDVDLAREVRPALTTVRIHKAWLGILGVRQLLERAEHPDQPALTQVVATRLIERESVCNASQQRKRGGG